MGDTAPYVSPLLAAAAGGLYLTGEDNLRLTTWGAVAGITVAIEGRLLSPDGCSTPLAETQLPNSDRSAKTTLHPLREGILTNIQLRASGGTALVGGVGAVLEIVRGFGGAVQPLGTLLQGYVTSATRLAWPGSPITPLTAGAGRLRVIVGTDPAAGVEILETVPTGARWKLRSVAFTLVTAVAVANRTPVLTIDDGANILWEVGTNVAQTASQAAKYRAGVGVPLTTFGALSYLLPLPSELPLAAGSRIRTVTGALQAADDYSAPIYTVEEFIEE